LRGRVATDARPSPVMRRPVRTARRASVFARWCAFAHLAVLAEESLTKA
jgi:hypothetical protein